MVQIIDKRSGSVLGTLEEESSTDDDYYLNRATVDILEEEGADAALVALLRQALGNGDEAEIRWQRS